MTSVCLLFIHQNRLFSQRSEEMIMRRFISGILSVLLCVTVLCGCSSTYSPDQLYGEWYQEANGQGAFIFLEDGTCYMENHMNTGTWELVNGNQLIISGFHDNPVTIDIKKLKGDRMVIAFEGEKGTLVRMNSGESEETSAAEETSGSAEIPISAETLQLGDYTVDSFIAKGEIGYPYAIGSDEYFWVYATDKNSEKRQLCIDYNLNVKLDFPMIRYGFPYIVENRYVICPPGIQFYNDEEKDKAVFDLKANNVTADFCKGNEKFSGAFMDRNGASFWVYETAERNGSEDLILRAKDVSGKVLGEWSSAALKKKYEHLQMSETVMYIYDSWYRSGNLLINLDSKTEICSEIMPASLEDSTPYMYGVDENYVFIMNYDQQKMELYDAGGKNITPPQAASLDGGKVFSDYCGEGVIEFYGTDREYIDASGNTVFENISSDSGIIRMDRGNALIELYSSQNSTYVTIADQKGEYLFEPLEGSYLMYINDDMQEFRYSMQNESGYYRMDGSGNLIDGKAGVYLLEGKQLKTAIALENGELKTYPVEIIKHDEVGSLGISIMDSTASQTRKGTVYVDPNASSNRIKVRTSPGLNGNDTGERLYNGDSVTVYEETQADGYTWYRIGENRWMADNGKSFGVKFK